VRIRASARFIATLIKVELLFGFDGTWYIQWYIPIVVVFTGENFSNVTLQFLFSTLLILKYVFMANIFE